MTGPDLFAATRPNDLPPSWDGAPIEWDPDWAWPLVMHICPPPRQRPDVCPRCGSTAARPQRCGRIWSDALPDVIAGTIGPWRTRPRPHHVVATFTAWRCTDCRHDQVLERGHDPLAPGRLWDLDPDDYLDTGSTAP